MKHFTIFLAAVAALLLSANAGAQTRIRHNHEASLGALLTSPVQDDPVTKGYASLGYAWKPVIASNDLATVRLTAGANVLFSLPHRGENAHVTAGINAGAALQTGCIELRPFAEAGLLAKDGHRHVYASPGLRLTANLGLVTAIHFEWRAIREMRCLTNHTDIAPKDRQVIGLGLTFSFL